MVERLQASIDAGETWMVYDGDQTSATLALDRYADPQLWTPEERDQPAFYLHRLIVDRDHAGHGHGANLIDWACDHAAVEARTLGPHRRLDHQHRAPALLPRPRLPTRPR